MAGIVEYMNEHTLVFDGAMGTMLQARGFQSGALPETLNEANPELILGVHRAYVEAGADVVTANTFQANELKMGAAARGAVLAGVELAKKSGARFVALDVGPLGQMLRPLGALAFEDAVRIFKAQMRAAEDAGADVILIETFSDIHEAKAAIIAAKEETKLPIFCSMSYEEGGRTFMGLPAEAAAVTLSALGVSALGANCSLGPEKLAPTVLKLLKYASVPVLLQANAGLPRMKDGCAAYDMPLDEYIRPVKAMIEAGVRVVGGCCGTTPETIRALRAIADAQKPFKPSAPRVTACASASQLIEFASSPVIVGDRLNPAGRADIQAALLDGEYYVLSDEALEQLDEGAQVLDLSVAAPGVDEAAAMPCAVEEIQMVSAAPLMLDSTNFDALEAGLRACRGRPILNSIPGMDADMARLFPLAKKYGALVVAMTIDENGTPSTAAGRLEIAKKLLKCALEHGLSKEDLLIDCVVLTKAHQPEQRQETLSAVSLVKEKLGLKTLLGIRNISYGLEGREAIDAAFLKDAIAAGLNAALLNPAHAMG